MFRYPSTSYSHSQSGVFFVVLVNLVQHVVLSLGLPQRSTISYPRRGLKEPLPRVPGEHTTTFWAFDRSSVCQGDESAALTFAAPPLDGDPFPELRGDHRHGKQRETGAVGGFHGQSRLELGPRRAWKTRAPSQARSASGRRRRSHGSTCHDMGQSSFHTHQVPIKVFLSHPFVS